MTLIEKLIILLLLVVGAYLFFNPQIIGWEKNETTIYPVRCVQSLGEFLGVPKCKAEPRYTYVVDAKAGEVHIKSDNPDDYITWKRCSVDSADDFICPPQVRTLMEGRRSMLGPVLCTVEQLKSGACPDIEKNVTRNFGAMSDVVPSLAIAHGRPLRNSSDCLMSRYYVGVFRWYLIKGAEVVGGISLWPSRPEECRPARL